MCDCLSSTALSFSAIQIPTSPPKRCVSLNPNTSRNGLSKSIISSKATKNSRQFYDNLGFKYRGNDNLELKSTTRSEDKTGSPDLDVIELKESVEDDDLIRVCDRSEKIGFRRGKQVVKRSTLLAKQVISLQSALNLGFVTQIWVDIDSWMVLVVEVRPNLISGESERFLLQDVRQVGDVVLVEDESVLENELKLVGLETLVGYNVVTPGRRFIGKVRGYSFNINSGTVELLELDSFGISIIPSSLVSTYALPVEDVLEVFADTVIVHEAAASRIQRLTKGFWNAQKVGTSIDETEEYSDSKFPVKSHSGLNTRRTTRNKKFRPKIVESEDDWELPMDYL